MAGQEVLLVTGSFDRDIRFWEASSGICSRTINRSGSTDAGQVNRLAISPDKRLLAAAIHRKIYIYDVADQNQSPLTTLDGHTMNVTAVCFHSGSKWLATSSEDGSIRIWDLRTFALRRKYESGQAVNDLIIHPNQGELISCDQAGVVKHWDLSDPNNSAAFDLSPHADSPMRSVSISTDGLCLVAGSVKGKIFVWTASDNISEIPYFQFSQSFVAHGHYLTKVLISPNTKYLATCSADASVKIWEISPSYQFTLDKTLVGHDPTRWVWDAAFNSDSAYLVTASSDHVARLWKISTGETERVFNGHFKAAVCCALHDAAV